MIFQKIIFINVFFNPHGATFGRNLTEFRQKTVYLQSKETSGGACLGGAA